MTTIPSNVAATLDQYSKPVRSNPILFRLNGIGFGFSGTALRHPDLGQPLFVRMHWFTLAWIPILPLGIYLLSNPVDERGRKQEGNYFIHRTVKIKGVTEIWGLGKFLGMLFSGWLICLAVVLAIGAALGVFAMLPR